MAESFPASSSCLILSPKTRKDKGLGQLGQASIPYYPNNGLSLFLPPNLNASLTKLVKDYAVSLGFDLVGITLPHSPPRMAQFQLWLEQGFAGEMQYLKNGAQSR